MPSILFITTNETWGGSEELWTRSAINFIAKGFDINYAAPYNHPDSLRLHKKEITIFPKPENIYRKVLNKSGLTKCTLTHLLTKYLKKASIDLVIISQGKNIPITQVMETCRLFNIPYVTITQLVAELHYLEINNNTIDKILPAYLHARMNFFVSKRNLILNNQMLGMRLPNTDVIFNPCKINESEIPKFPNNNFSYKIAFVGRLECYHKGLDLLLDVASKKKWRERPVEFNIYGEGPHKRILEKSISLLSLDNVHLHGYTKHIPDIWKLNQMLILPSRIEGQSLALIEAMKCGRPSVVTNVGGAPELIQDGYNGFIAEAATVDFIDSALERAWLQRNFWEIMGLNAMRNLKLTFPEDPIEYFNNKIQDLIE